MKKYIVVPILALVSAFVVYNSVYVEPLDVKVGREKKKNFNPKETMASFGTPTFNEILKTAIDLRAFDSLLAVNPRYLMERYGKSVGISSNYSFLVKGVAKKTGKSDEHMPVVLPNGKAAFVLRVKFIFGNSARDALGCFKVEDFNNTMDFNAVATELNTRIVKEVIADKVGVAAPGTTVRFTGAVEINSENINKQLDIVPLEIEILR